MTIVTLFVPLPLFAAGWQAALGSGGWLPVALWSTPPQGDPDVGPSGIAWKPWAQGLEAAIWIHAVAALPWVVLLVGQGLRWVEGELEEDALMIISSWRVLLRVSLPRSRAALGAAAIWVALQTATEITVTDMMQVRTFAEEVYNQYARQDSGGDADWRGLAARAVAVSLPALAIAWVLIGLAVRSWEKRLPPPGSLLAPPLQFSLGRLRWPVLAVVLVTIGLLSGVPIGSLIWKSGLAGRPESWSPAETLTSFRTVLRVHGTVVVESVGVAGLSGLCAACLAWLICWLAQEGSWFRIGVFVLLTAAWALPGPVIGLGLKDAISLILDVTHSDMLATLLYFGPSPAPVVWAQVVRFLPCAVALLWPVVRLVPAELRESARVEGARPYQELRHVVLPLTWSAGLCAGLAVAVLSLGELSAGKLVAIPGWQPFAHEVFVQMHYGVGNHLAALCLLLLALVGLGGLLVLGVSRLRPSRR